MLDELQQLTYNDENHSKVDRIIFVASAKSRECPTELIKAVRSQAMDGRRGKDSSCSFLVCVRVKGRHVYYMYQVN